MKLEKDFYLREDVVEISKELLGKYLYTKIDGKVTAGIITETEAYAGESDRASHAYNNRRTNRTEIMFAEGGVSYVYLCYGIHHLFNVVTNFKNTPHAVLIRAIKPVEGLPEILRRRKLDASKENIAAVKSGKKRLLAVRELFHRLSESKPYILVWILPETRSGLKTKVRLYCQRILLPVHVLVLIMREKMRSSPIVLF